MEISSLKFKFMFEIFLFVFKYVVTGNISYTLNKKIGIDKEAPKKICIWYINFLAGAVARS